MRQKAETVKGASTPDERRAIAADLEMMISDAETAKGDLPERWKALEALYNCEEFERAFMPHEGAASYGLPLMTTRIDVAENSITGPMLQAKPYFTASVAGADANHTDIVEQSIQWVYDQALWAERLKQGVHMAMVPGVCIFRSWFDARVKGFTADTPDLQSYNTSEPEALEDDMMEMTVPMDGAEMPPEAQEIEDVQEELPEIEYAAIRKDVIHPQDFVCYPPTASKVPMARMVGHREYMRRTDVEAFQNAGMWFNDVPLADGTVEIAGKSKEFAKTQQVVSIFGDQPITLWFLTVKLDLEKTGTEKWYEVIYARDTDQILEIVPYKWSRPGYFTAGVLPKEYRTIFPALSPAKKLEGLTLIFNEIANLHIDGTEMSAMPTTFYDPNSGALSDQSTQYSPGELIPTNGPPNVASVGSKYDSSNTVQLLGFIKELSDEAMQTPVTSLGGQYAPGTTARAADQSAAGQASSVNGMLQTFAGAELCSMVAFDQELLAANADVFEAVYGDACPWISAPEALRGKYTWEVTGKSPNAFGAALVQNLQSVVQIAQGMGLDYMIDKKALLQSTISALDLPAGSRIMHSEEEIADLEMQQQQAAQAEAEAQMAMGQQPAQGVPNASR